MRIHPVVNINRIVQYKEQVRGQKKEEGKPVEVEGVDEWEVEKILNKKRMRGVEKYLVQWKGFTAKGDTWEKRENLKNAEELIEEFERGGVEVRQQEKIEKKMNIGGWNYWGGIQLSCCMSEMIRSLRKILKEVRKKLEEVEER